MANNKVSSLFNKTLPRPPRANFNLGNVNRFTADVGYVIPCYVEEVLPNSYKRLDINALVQTNATVAPLMGSFTAKFEAFFVPLRLYYRHLDLNNIRPDFHDNFDYHYIETLKRPAAGSTSLARVKRESNSALGDAIGHYVMQVAPGSLIDYLGIMPVGHNDATFGNSIPLDANPFIGYFDIYRNYYANPHDRRIPYRVQNNTTPIDSRNRVVPQYRYFNLDDLDHFITTISDRSVTNQPGLGVSPSSVDVWEVLRDTVHDDQVSIYIGSSTPSDQLPFVGLPLFANQEIRVPGAGVAQFAALDTSNGLNFGLLPRTYKDDYFNSRFMNEFVSYMEQTSAVTVENNLFYITQLRLQNRIAKYVDKSIFSDTRFGSWIKAHFGTKTNSKLNIPQFLGSISSNVVFNDIYATAQTSQNGTITSNEALGSRASLGQGYVKNGKGSFIEFKASEPGYIMIMFSLVPNVNYFQGFRKMYLKSSFNDMYKPEFDAVGYQDLQKLELDGIYRGFPVEVSYVDDRSFSWLASITSYNVPIGKQPSWIEYMTRYDESHGLMTKRYQFGFWTLNRPYNPGVYDEDFDYDEQNPHNTFVPGSPSFESSTYIFPEYFNTIFAVDKYTHNFQVQVRFFDKTKQPMSKQILPHL